MARGWWAGKIRRTWLYVRPSIPAEERGALTLERVPRKPRGWAVALSVVLPGSGQIVEGATGRGLLFLLPWLLLLGALYLGWGRLLEIAGRRQPFSLGDWVAILGLGVTMLAVWGLAVVDLVQAPARALRARGDSQWRIAARHFRRSKLALAGVGVIFLLYAVAVLAPLLAPYDPIAQPLNLVASSYLAPFAGGHLLGTDQLGRDILSRIIYGSRVSLIVGFAAVIIGGAIGGSLGLLSGYAGGIVDEIIMLLVDAQLAFPFILLAIGIIAVLGPSFGNLIVIVGLSGWVTYARLVRAQVLTVKEREYVLAIRGLGGSTWRILTSHIVPNTLAPFLVVTTLELARTILLESTLSFLGLGIQPPTPSWGGMLNEGRSYLDSAWWISALPGLILMLTALVVSRVGDWLRDVLDPTLRGA